MKPLLPRRLNYVLFWLGLIACAFAAEDRVFVQLTNAVITTPPVQLWTRTYRVDTGLLFEHLHRTTNARVNSTNWNDAQEAVRDFVAAVGVKLDPPKAIFFNNRHGTLLVRATETDHDLLNTALSSICPLPPQVNFRCEVIIMPEDLLTLIGITNAPAPQQPVVLTTAQAKALVGTLKGEQTVTSIQNPDVTTQHLKPVRIACVDIRTIVTGTDLDVSGRSPRTNQLNAPSLEVTPTLSADEFEIQIKGIAEFKEALNLDKIVEPREAPIDAAKADLHLQPCQFTFAANLWDGQTLALAAPKDKRILVSGRVIKPQHRLVFLVTPTITSRTGDRIHTDAQLAFTTNTIPAQPNKAN